MSPCFVIGWTPGRAFLDINTEAFSITMKTPPVFKKDSKRVAQRFTDEEWKRMDELLVVKRQYEEKRDILNKQLEEVNVKIIEAQSEYGAIRNKHSPILQLPVEVTCFIFEHTQLPISVDEEKEEEEEEEEPQYLMEVVVSHVCRRWRKIALGYPKLWSSFYYEADESLRDPSCVPLDRLESYLERSAALPLRLWFDFGRGSSDPELYHKLIDRSIDHVHRWKHFTLFYTEMFFLSDHTSRLSDVSAPFLEYLVLCSNAEDWDQIESEPVVTNLDPIVLTNGAPKLTYLMLDGTSIFCIPPLSNITTLRLEKAEGVGRYFNESTFLVLLSLPSLEQLSLVADVFTDQNVDQHIHMPNLKRLRVANLDSPRFSSILANIHAPQLETFIIHTCMTGLDSQLEPYTYPALRKLWIVDSLMDTTVAALVVQLTSQATDVFISQENIDDGFFYSLCQDLTTTEELTWPRLKTLKCNVEGYSDIDPYLSFARSRPEQSFTLILHRELVEYWSTEYPISLLELKEICMLDEVADEDWIQKESFWPENMDLAPGFDIQGRDPFAIDTYYSAP